MLFSTNMLLVAGGTILLAGAEKICEGFGFERMGVVIKLILPIVGFGMAIYFLEVNPMLKWLGL